MLRRAASNAYSWWWASHIRTNQSKWLENILQEMDDRVKSMLKIIEEDADSFSKKAELYFKKRPELTNFVEETYRAYRALAERYDHISGELHKANHTIASAFPDQVQFDEQDEDDDHLPRAITSIDFSRVNRLALDVSLDSLVSIKKGKTSSVKSYILPIDRSRVPEEIDKIQKEILVLQTEKEFVRSSYEIAISRYQEIEKQIVSMQDELGLLHDEFNEGVIIEDNEARTLMATAALKSCEDALLSLQENQKRSEKFTRMGSKRIMMAKEKLTSFKEAQGEKKIIFEESKRINLDGLFVEAPKQNQLSVQICTDMPLVDLAEKIDELVNKVITLELTTSSQNAKIESLRLETDKLHQHVESLEEKNLTSVDGSDDLNNRLQQTKGELQIVKDNNKFFADENADNFFDNHNIIQESTFFSTESSMSQDKEMKEANKLRDVLVVDEVNEIHESVDYASQLCRESETQFSHQDESFKVLQSMLNGVEDKEKVLLTEYTSILRNYRKIKNRLSEVEQRNQDYVLETMAQLAELKKANDTKDEELRLMQQMLSKQLRNVKKNEPEILKIEKRSSLQDFLIPESFSSIITVKKDLINEAIDSSQAASHAEEKFRSDIDALLDENLDFWLRFSSSFQQIQKIQLEFDSLQSSFKRLIERNSEDSSSSIFLSDSEPIEKQLRELKTELRVWLNQNDLLNGESEARSISLSSIQEEITEALASSLESDGYFLLPLQAAKFQGEVSSMQHENNKVAAELQAGIDHIKGLRTEVDKILSEFKKFELPNYQANQHYSNPIRNFPAKTRIPLRNFLFGVKPKKKLSIFRCMNPAYQKQYSDLSSGFPS